MMTSVGSINERGYLKGFKRRGYTLPKCLLELVANSLDSIDKKGAGDGVIRFDVGISEIRMSDRGSMGMDRAAITGMFDLHRENHASDASRGVSGIGAKPALSNLSGDRNMHLLTHTIGGEYLRVDIPWAKIHGEGRYTGMVTIAKMSADEIAAFGTASGTTLVFPYSDILEDLLYDNFTPLGPDTTLPAPLDRISVVFGRERVRMEYKHHEDPEVKILPMYNYFDAPSSDYYTGLRTATIEHWFSVAEDRDRFICEGKEIPKMGRGYSKTPEDVVSNLHGYQRIGDYTLLVGLRRDEAIFDAAHPVMPTADKKKHRNAYNLPFLGEENHEFLAHSKLVRNGQTIGLIPLADKNIANARGGGYSLLSMRLLQCEVRFNPVSAQDNRQDKVMGIQENKNQFDGESLPVTFSRMIFAIREQKAHDIWNYFQRTVAPAAAAASDEEESEEEEEVDESEEEPAPAPAPAPVPTPAPSPAPSISGHQMIQRLQALASRINPTTPITADIMSYIVALENAFP